MVGIDPGIRIGLAIFDLNAREIHTATIRGGKERVIREISKYGIPCVVATDSASPPKLVHQIASCFGAKLHAPKKDMKKGEKEKLVRFGLNSHERDALAAVLNFFKRMRNKFKWIERKAKEIGANPEELKLCAIEGIPIGKAKQHKQRFKKIG